MPDRYRELKKVHIEVNYIVMMYGTNAEKVPLVQNWLGWGVYLSSRTCTEAEQDNVKLLKNYLVSSENLGHSTIKLLYLHHYKWSRWTEETAEDCMGTQNNDSTL